MNRTKLACLATTALFGGLLSATGAFAQSTATTELDTVVVTADRLLDVQAGRYVDKPQVTIVDGRIGLVLPT